MTLPTDDASPVCSAKGCRESATWVLAWNNPKLHTPDRRKTWTACERHRVGLTDFLTRRDFLKQVVAYADWPAAADRSND